MVIHEYKSQYTYMYMYIFLFYTQIFVLDAAASLDDPTHAEGTKS